MTLASMTSTGCRSMQLTAKLSWRRLLNLLGIAKKILGMLGNEVTVSTRWDDLGFDDLDKVEVLLEVEEEFDHTMPDEEADAINSVEETIAYLRKHKLA